MDGALGKPRRRREHHQTKGLMSRTIAVHVRFESWYISLPKKTTTATATATSLNKRFNEQNNSCARAL